MLRLVADESIPYLEPFFADLCHIQRLPGRAIGPEQVRAADLLMVRTITQINAQLLAASQVRWVGSASIGCDHVDVDWLHAQNIGFAHAPGCNAQAVVEYVLSALASLIEDWQDLPEKNILVVGVGNVGGRLLQSLRALGLDAWGYDPLLPEDSAYKPYLVDRWAAIAEADIICVHTPLTKAGPAPTQHLFDAQSLARLKPEVLLLNAGRGAVLDNQALLQWHKQCPKARIALDVWEHEPNLLADLARAVDLATPHIAGYSLEGKLNATRMLYQAAAKQWAWPDNTPVLDLPEAPSHDLDTGVDNLVTDGLNALRRLCLQNYHPRVDHQALLNSLPSAKAFDELRKHYCFRRELASCALQFSQPNAELSRLLERLFAVK